VTPSINVLMDAASAELVPERMLGRVDATLALLAPGMAPLGPVLGGALAQTVGAELGLVLLGALLVLTALGAALDRDLGGFASSVPPR
jgi:hypothetical protein